MSDVTELLRRVVRGEGLSKADVDGVIGAFLDGETTPGQAGALLAALATKGETPEEVAGAALAMRARSVHVEHGLPDVLDVCGTGGDRSGTINISTCAAFVIAGCGVPVAKHGNRAATSKCGSADVLEALGVQIDVGPEMAAESLRENNITFMFAPRYHPAMKNVAPVRRELGIHTLFNMIGPLSNPAGANRQLIGVAHERHLMLIAEALRELGARSGAVVHAANGLDEIAGDVPTRVFQFDGAASYGWTLDPSDYRISASLASLAGGDAAFNAQVLLQILQGEASDPADVVMLNAALGLVVAGAAPDMWEALEMARRSIAGGAALAALEALRRAKEVEFA